MMVSREKIGKRCAKFLKRLVDIAGSCLGIAAALPFFIILPIIIKIESEGPVIHKRKVVGENDFAFFAYKFRTMVRDAEKILEKDRELNNHYLESFKLKEDPRITKTGYILRKYSLDEIPQFINVLRGQMSLVGPRMMTVMELQEYGKKRDLVLSVKPGMTGLWQISGRQCVPFQRRIELDITYVKNWSLWKDMVIILKSFYVVFKAEGAY